MSGYTRGALDLHGAFQGVLARRQLEQSMAQVVDQRLAAKRGELRTFGKSGRMTRQLSLRSVMNAVNGEGQAVLSKDAEGYWKDQDRREFGINVDAVRSPRVMRNRFGKVTYRKVWGPDGVREYGKLIGRI